MNYTDFIKKLDHKSNPERLGIIIAWLHDHHIPYRSQEYRTGVNLLVDLGSATKRIGISSHFDKVKESGGANDNGSAIAVCLDMIERFAAKKEAAPAVRIFFFDQEETGLLGSAAYTKQYGVADLSGLINMELVGMGDKLALWPLDSKYKGSLLATVEQTARQENIDTIRFDRIVTNTADHLSFRDAGLADAFTLTCISASDIKAAERYYKAMQQGAGAGTLYDILHQAPVFAHYHQPSDTSDKLTNSAMSMTADLIWHAIHNFSNLKFT